MNDYLEYLEFSDIELVNFLNKFSTSNLEVFNLILYFSNFSGYNDLIQRLNIAKEKVDSKNIKTKIEQDISLLSEKELELLIGLLEESTLCSSSDSRYTNETIYLDYLNTHAQLQLERIHHKKMILSI